MSLFPRPQAQSQGFLQLVRSDPEAAARSLMNSNPAFAEFVRRNQGKSPEQIAREAGIDYSIVRRMLGQ